MIGIPYAFVNNDDGSRTCPICRERIPETYANDGEQVSNNYAAHYAAEHQDKEKEPSLPV